MRAVKRRARRATAGALALAAGSLAIIPAADAQAPAGPRFGENYRLQAADTSGRSRDVPGLAANPANPNHIVEADSNPITLQCDYHVSFDGGRTWSGGHLTIRNSGENPPFPSPACEQNFDSGGYHHFNTGVVFGSGQNVYITFSAHRGPFNRPESGIEGGAGDDSVVARSTDGGRTFQPAVVAIPGGGPNPQPMRMRPQLAVERGAGSGGQDRLYANAWECFRRSGGCSGGGGDRRIFVARSDDGGATWTAPVLSSAKDVRTDPALIAQAGSPDEQAREPSQPVVGPDGAIYVAYRNRDATEGTSACPPNPDSGGQRRNCVVVARSTNQGQTWQHFSTGLPINPGTLTNPRLAIDPTTPAGAGTLYVVYQRAVGAGTADTDISLQRSTDRGQTWSSPPVRVNDDPAGSVQTNPWVSVGPGGRVDVIWADRRHNYPGGGSHADMYYARSTDGGASFAPNRRVTDRTINIDVGRYNDLGSQFSPGFSWYGPVSLPLADGRVLTAWQDSREGNFDTGFQDIYLSRLDPAAPIATSRIATATPPGLSVMLSRLAWPGGAEAVGGSGGDPVTRVVAVNEGDLAGALAGAVLARANWGPLLLSPPDRLPAHVQAEATRMKPEGAFVIGDSSSLSSGVSSDLRESTRAGENVARVAAPQTVAVANRPAETARRIAELLRPLPGVSPEAVIANPRTPEAASASALAAALKLPILFVDERTSLPPPTAQAISSLGIKKALIAGGPGAVNAGVEASLNTSLGAGNVKRLGGSDQYATSESVLAESRLRGLPANVVYVADGGRPVEGALLGAAVGRLNGLMLLTPSADSATAESRLGTLGVGAAVDRLVATIGAGGVDPVVPTGGFYPLPYPQPRRSDPFAGCPALVANVIRGTSAGERITGTVRADRIFAGAGSDTVDALPGSDCVDLGTGADRGQGGLGNDLVLGGLGGDRLSGSSGNDRLRGGPGNDRLDSGRGNDRAFADQGNDVILGSFGNDVLHGVSGQDRISGSRGRDRINGGAGSDAVSAGSSDDRVAGDRDSDRINGNSGDDRLEGNSGNDRVTGGTGRDMISGGGGRDRIDARDRKRDRISCGRGRDTVIADRTDRVAGSCERVRRR